MNSENEPINLIVVHPTYFGQIHKKKQKTKTKTWIGAMHGMTEGEKRRMLKESVSVKDTKIVDEITKEILGKANPVVQGNSSRILEEHMDIFLEKTPYGPPPH